MVTELLYVLIHVFYVFNLWFKYNSGQKYDAPQVQSDQGLISWPSDHGSTFHVTETSALTTWPSLTYYSYKNFWVLLTRNLRIASGNIICFARAENNIVM